jgi:hypothetical protein
MPTADEAPIQKLLEELDAAEAAQQKLMQSGKLAEAAAQGSQPVKTMLLVELLLQQEDVTTSLQEGELCAQLVQLLCLHGRAATALQLLPVGLSSSTELHTAGIAAAMAAAAAAAANSNSSQQQQDLLELLEGSSLLEAGSCARCTVRRSH